MDLRSGAPLQAGDAVEAVVASEFSSEVKIPKLSSPQFFNRYWNYEESCQHVVCHLSVRDALFSNPKQWLGADIKSKAYSAFQFWECAGVMLCIRNALSWYKQEVVPLKPKMQGREWMLHDT